MNVAKAINEALRAQRLRDLVRVIRPYIDRNLIAEVRQVGDLWQARLRDIYGGVWDEEEFAARDQAVTWAKQQVDPLPGAPWERVA